MKTILHFLRQFMFGNDLARNLSKVVVFIDLERDRDIALELYCDSTEQLALGSRLERLLERVPLGVAISVYLSVLLVLNLRLLGLSRSLGLLGLASLVALAVVLLSIELLRAILVIVVLAIAIVRVSTAATLTEASPPLPALVVLLLLIGLLVAVPRLTRVQRVIIGLALVLPIVLLSAASTLVPGVVVGPRLLAGPARLLLVLAVRHFIIIICHIVSRRVLGLLASVVTLPVLVPRVVLIALVLVTLVLPIVPIALVSILVVGPLVGP